MKRIRERLCLCCKDFFTPDCRNTKKQDYCNKDECRKASKAVSQRQWSRENPDYFKGSVHVNVRDRILSTTSPPTVLSESTCVRAVVTAPIHSGR